jgi:hypothetical protein
MATRAVACVGGHGPLTDVPTSSLAGVEFMANTKTKESIVDDRSSELRFEPGANRLIHNGHLVLWDAYFFERGIRGPTYRLFFFADGHQVWMRDEAWACLKEYRKRKPFDVPRDLVLTESPPLDQLMCHARSIHGDLTPAQQGIMNALTNWLS